MLEETKIEIRKYISSILYKMLERANYFVVDDTQASEWRHFGLNFDIYTHFTSPIRRYPDVLVHRLLNKALTY
jgi:exoribonuclease R